MKLNVLTKDQMVFQIGVKNAKRGCLIFSSPFGYLVFLFFLILPSLGFRKRFSIQDIRKLITAPMEAKMAVITISSV